MSTLTLEIPDSLDMSQEDAARFLAAKLYESGKLTLGQAAEMVGMKKWDFPAVLAKYGVDYFQYTAEDAINDANQIR